MLFHSLKNKVWVNEFRSVVSLLLLLVVTVFVIQLIINANEQEVTKVMTGIS